MESGFSRNQPRAAAKTPSEKPKRVVSLYEHPSEPPRNRHHAFRSSQIVIDLPIQVSTPALPTTGPTVAVVFQHIGPYHHARLNAAARFLRIVGVEWSAYDTFGWGRAAEPAAYRKVSLLENSHRGTHANSVLASRMTAALEEIRPDAVAVNGWGDFGSAITLDGCRRQRIPIVLMSESSAHDERRTWIKESIKTRILRLCPAALVGGQSHVAYLAALGLSPERISTGYDVVDNAYFARGADAARANPGPHRQRLGLPQNYFLASTDSFPRRTSCSSFAPMRGIVPCTARRPAPWGRGRRQGMETGSAGRWSAAARNRADWLGICMSRMR